MLRCPDGGGGVALSLASEMQVQFDSSQRGLPRPVKNISITGPEKLLGCFKMTMVGVTVPLQGPTSFETS